jgi:hypothetical protein
MIAIPRWRIAFSKALRPSALHAVCILGTLILCAVSFALPAHAQNGRISPESIESSPDEDSVADRARPEYDAQGIPAGGFRLYPTLAISGIYDDNVFRAPSNAGSDYYLEVAPQINLRSQWSRNFLGLKVAAKQDHYARFSSETRTEWTIAAAGRLDILTGTGLSGNVQHTATFEERNSPDQVNAAEPTPIKESQARLVFSYNPYRIGVQLSAEYDRFAFDSTKLVGGGFLDNSDRDRDEYVTSLTALYEASPGYGIFLRSTYEKRVYDLQTDRAFGRDSQGYRMDAGFDLLLSSLIRGEAYAGYLRQDLQNPAFDDLSGIDYGAALRWFPTELITVRLDAARTPSATTIAGASLSDHKSVAVGIDYEFRRNVILQANAGYDNTDFQGTTRRDQTFSTAIGVRYLLNPYVTANAKFTHESRDSTLNASDYRDNTISLGVSVHI